MYPCCASYLRKNRPRNMPCELGRAFSCLTLFSFPASLNRVSGRNQGCRPPLPCAGSWIFRNKLPPPKLVRISRLIPAGVGFWGEPFCEQRSLPGSRCLETRRYADAPDARVLVVFRGLGLPGSVRDHSRRWVCLPYDFAASDVLPSTGSPFALSMFQISGLKTAQVYYVL